MLQDSDSGCGAAGHGWQMLSGMDVEHKNTPA